MGPHRAALHLPVAQTARSLSGLTLEALWAGSPLQPAGPPRPLQL